jgi:hypothetical protein
MKTIIILFLGFLFSFSCKNSLFAGGKKVSEIHESVKQFYGTDSIEVIQSPVSIEVYTLDPKKSKETNVHKIGDFKIIYRSYNMSAVSTQELQSILLDHTNYDFVNAKRGFFFPEIALKFIRTDNEIILLFDFFRNEIVLIKNGVEKKTNFDSGREKIIPILKSNLGDNFKINQVD